MPQIFEMLFQTEDINNFVHHGIISVLQFQMKSSFSREKNSRSGI